MVKSKKPSEEMLAGLAARLSDFIAANRELRRRGEAAAADSGAVIAEWLALRGEPVGARAVNNWIRGRNEPGAGFVLLLEELIGMPWRSLCDPRVPTPSPAEAAAYRAGIKLRRSSAAASDALAASIARAPSKRAR